MMDIFRKFSLPYLAVILTVVPGMHAQGLGSLLGGSKTTAPSAPTDPLKRTTPRSSVYNFLEACHAERYAQAARYMDLRRLPVADRASEGADLAKELADLLDRDPQFELGQMSDTAAGNMADGLTADLEPLITVPVNGEPVPLYLQRVMQQNVEVWLVSADSVLKLPQMTELEQETPFEKRLPAPLVKTTLLGTPLWIWIVLVLAGLLLSLLSRKVTKLLIAITVPLARRYATSLHSYRIESFTEPLRLLLSIVVFRTLLEFVAPSALLRDYLLKLLVVMFAFGVASFLVRIVDVILDQIQSRLNARERALTYSVLPLGMRVLKLIIFCLAILFTLSGWGYNTNTILAGLGVGGLAVALAAQKTIENFFGGIEVITDRPVLVGDFFKFGGQVGTVEDIGLRSTRIRTLDRTLVTIPNSQFSTMTLENYSRRDRMWFHPTLHLRRDTTAAQVRSMMEKLTAILGEHPMVSIGGVPLRFTQIDDQSLNLEIFAYVLSDDFDEFLKVQSELLLKFLEAGTELGVGFAVPLTESVSLNIPPEAATEVYRGLKGRM
jgi:MscS family membrane protein